MTITGTMRALDETRGAVRMEDVFETDVEDLWHACTTPERLARWIAEVSGDFRQGGTVQLLFTSTWSGPATIEACDAPHHLLLTTAPGTDDEAQVEAWLTPEGARTRLVVEERGLPVEGLHFYGAGWQVHLEDLARSLETDGPVHAGGWSAQEPAPAWHARWTELDRDYRERAVG
ncbi:SRPBCC domain-containing protein [Cellulomonas alba]|uniref:SRPBCC domain-containing protein n=1 Tax=Cellulomonas alba TaxID=3053467 RepID=A0ABT7SC70_9CELL|nr:SRPBCC domain-containing protein [Cellulomonas alba]MDM7853782.1 SRPBCC domain-containing protein [Cellulomonas alba]